MAAWTCGAYCWGCVGQAVKRLLRKCGSRDVTLFEVPGGYHELFMGPEKDLIMRRLIAWVLEHAALRSAQPS
jgi:alpha-beta hydrolase superfamily lysophospholipase